MATKKGHEIPTIDVVLVTVGPVEEGGDEIALDTASNIQVSPQIETEDAIKLIVKGRLVAQKPAVNTMTGNAITLTDNVFNPELVQILQGGVIKYWADADQGSTSDTDQGFGVASYTPPVAGAMSEQEVFPLNAYSAIYNAAGVITGYEKITYPNCQGVPVAFNSEDGVFRVAEYTINSAPAEGEAPYVINYVKNLPPVGTLGSLSVQSNAGTSGKTQLVVTPTKGLDSSYWTKVGSSLTLPKYHEVIGTGGGYATWNGTDEITATSGQEVMVVEVDSSNRALKAGKTTANVGT